MPASDVEQQFDVLLAVKRSKCVSRLHSSGGCGANTLCRSWQPCHGTDRLLDGAGQATDCRSSCAAGTGGNDTISTERLQQRLLTKNTGQFMYGNAQVLSSVPESAEAKFDSLAKGAVASGDEVDTPIPPDQLRVAAATALSAAAVKAKSMADAEEQEIQRLVSEVNSTAAAAVHYC